MTWIAVGVAVVGGVSKMISAKKDRDAREAEQKRANREVAMRRQRLESLDLTNPYANLQNTYEDLTINQQQVDFQRQQMAVQQANAMQNLQAAAGGSGVAGLAQQIMNQGQQMSGQIAGSIGQQERANQMARAQQEASIQSQKAQGDQWVYNKREARESDFLSAAMSEKTAADQSMNRAETLYNQGIWDTVGGVQGGINTYLDNRQAGRDQFHAYKQ